MRNLTKTIAAVSLLAPNGAYPLGIGELELHSALNQNLKAEISLHVSADENMSDIKVNLAPPAKFEEAGVPRNIFLAKIQFETIVKEDGSVVIQLNSKEALREPFLDFLLEVSWAKGNLYREFTVLIDPPATYPQDVVLVASNANIVEQTVDAGSSPASVSAIAIENRFQKQNEYGPTVKNDTLWEVAENFKTSDDVSVEQMAIAIYDANPHAFYQKNVNALMAGEKLRIPDNNEVLKLSRKQAIVEFRRQTNEWRGKMTSPAANEIAVAEVDAAKQKSQLKLLAPAEAEIKQQAVVTSGETNPAEAAEVKLAEEATKTDSGQDFQDIQARLDKLEQQLTAMQELLAFKDQQLAALQSEKTGADLQADSEDANSENIAAQAIASVTKPAESLRPVESLKQPIGDVQAVQPSSGEGIDPYYLVVGSVGSTLLLVLGWLWWRERKLEEDTTESMFASSSEIVLPETDEDLSIQAINGNSSYDVGTVGESSFLSEFIPDGFDALESEQSEVDPVSEADVYLAYGRYQQAEELMRQAIVDQPERDECKLKLLEIYYAEENKNAFEDYAIELVASGKKENAVFWSKVIEMGSEIIPGSELFAIDEDTDSHGTIETGENSNELESAESAAELTETDSLAMDLEISSFDTEIAASNVDGPVSDNFSSPSQDDHQEKDENEFDLSLLETEQLQSSKAEESDILSVDEQELENSAFDFSSFESKDADPLVNEELESAQNEIESLDFNFSDDDSGPDQDENLSEGSFDFNFDVDSPNTELEGGSIQDGNQVSDLTDIDEFETKIDLAKAYIDMGDEEAAKVIVEEVVEKGNDIQKREAQAVLDKL